MRAIEERPSALSFSLIYFLPPNGWHHDFMTSGSLETLVAVTLDFPVCCTLGRWPARTWKFFVLSLFTKSFSLPCVLPVSPVWLYSPQILITPIQSVPIAKIQIETIAFDIRIGSFINLNRHPATVNKSTCLMDEKFYFVSSRLTPFFVLFFAVTLPSIIFHKAKKLLKIRFETSVLRKINEKILFYFLPVLGAL